MHDGPSTIEIRIDLLEVEGLGQNDVVPLKVAVERELGRLLETRGAADIVPESRAYIAVESDLNGTDPGAEKDAFATGVADAIYRAMMQ